MIRRYCDACGDHISRNVVTDRYRPTKYLNHRNISAEVIVSFDGTANSGDLCLKCLRSILAEPDGERVE